MRESSQSLGNHTVGLACSKPPMAAVSLSAGRAAPQLGQGRLPARTSIQSDAVIAIFPVTGDDPTPACGAALTAAQTALATLQAALRHRRHWPRSKPHRKRSSNTEFEETEVRESKGPEEAEENGSAPPEPEEQ
jgi:hypothetical protein